MRTMVDDVYEQLKVAPEDVVLEVHDFVEFIINRRMQGKSAKKTELSIESFVGVLKNSPSFKGDPLEIQNRMRDEWA